MEPPTFIKEMEVRAQGYWSIAGVDEVGRGAIAGPVVAAAVILPVDPSIPWLCQVRDSKQLPAGKRESIYEMVREAAIPYGVGIVSHIDIDNVGIVRATRTAMTLAVSRLRTAPDYILVDALSLPRVRLPQCPVVHGDRICLSIACASIIAKVTRDRYMAELDGFYPGYGLAVHKGYATAEHLRSLKNLGFSSIHRRSFAPYKEVIKP